MRAKSQPANSDTRIQLSEFFQKTSLHGWQYIGPSKNWCHNISWSLIVVFSLAIGVAFTYHSTMEYVNSGTVTSISSTTAPLEDITYPNIVICNVNHVSSSFLRSINISKGDGNDQRILIDHFVHGFETIQDEQKNQARLQNVLERMRSIHKWNESINFYTLGNQMCNDMILFAKWKQAEYLPANKSLPLVTDFGSCCEINPFLHFEKNLSESETTNEQWLNIPKGFTRNGLQNGLKILIDAETFDYAYYGNAAQGFRAAVDDANNRVMIHQQGFNINTGIELLAAMDMTIYNTTADALSLQPQIRDCYSTNELSLKYFNEDHKFKYSMRNCLYDAVLDKILTYCNCSPDLAGYWNLKTPCRGSNLTCAQKWLHNIGNPNYMKEDLTKINDNFARPCLQTCENQVTQVSLTHSYFPNRKNFPFRREFCLTMQKVAKICLDTFRKISFEESYASEITCQQILDAHNQDDMCKERLPSISHLQDHRNISEFLQRYAHENLAYVKLYIRDPFYTKIIRDKAVTTITFIGNTGGLLGLSMGFSFVTICEILYHAFKYLMNAIGSKTAKIQDGNTEDLGE